MTRKRAPHPDPHVQRPRFADLTRPEQLALATWMVLTKAADDAPLICGLSGHYTRAVGDIAVTVGLRSRKQRNYANPRTRRRTRRTPKAVTA